MTTQEKPPKRRWWNRVLPRFSLRTLLIVVLLFAAGYGLWRRRDAWVLERNLVFGAEFPDVDSDPMRHLLDVHHWERASFSADGTRFLAGKQEYPFDPMAKGFSPNYAEDAQTSTYRLDDGQLLFRDEHLEAWGLSPRGQWIYQDPESASGGWLMHADTGKRVNSSDQETGEKVFTREFLINSVRPNEFSGRAPARIALSPDESHAVYRDGQDALVVCDLLTRKPLLRLPVTPKDGPSHALFSPGGRYLATGPGPDGYESLDLLLLPSMEPLVLEAAVWDLRSGERVRLDAAPGARFRAFAPDDSTVVAEWFEEVTVSTVLLKTARLLDLRSGKVMAEWNDIGRVEGFSSDGRRLLLCTPLELSDAQTESSESEKQTVTVVDVESLRPLAAFKARGYEVGFSPDGTKVLVADMTGANGDPHVMDVHDAQSGARLCTLPQGLPGGIGRDRMLAPNAGDDDGNGKDLVHVMDLATGERLATLQGPPSRLHDSRYPAKVCAAIFTEGDAGIWIARNDRTVQYWERRRDESEWGILMLPECWLTAAFALLLVWSLVRDFRTLRKAAT